MNTKLFYRVANNETQQGLWYDFDGNFTGLIHDEFSFCVNNKLQMPYDENIIGWLSATEAIEELFYWFTKEDIKRLENYGFKITIYESKEYKFYNNHWVIRQDCSSILKTLNL